MCSLSSIDPATPDGPCASLFVGSPANDGTGSAYLFSADESSFCCVSSTPDISCTMTAPERDFYKSVCEPPSKFHQALQCNPAPLRTSLLPWLSGFLLVLSSWPAPLPTLPRYFTYNGVSDGYVSESGYYSGRVMNYSMHLTDPSNFYFWWATLRALGAQPLLSSLWEHPFFSCPLPLGTFTFQSPQLGATWWWWCWCWWWWVFVRYGRRYYTDMDGFPVEQGEGACVMPRGCPGAQGPKYLFHQYDRATIAQPPAPFQANSTFAVPAVCLGDHVPTCEVTPDNLCANAPPPQP